MPASPTAGPDVAAAFAELAETLASDLDIDSYLTATCRHCLRLIPVESAATLFDPRGVPAELVRRILVRLLDGSPPRGEEVQRLISALAAGGRIAGFTIMNDWSARDVQQPEMRIGLGPAKAKDFATSIGPVLVTADEFDGSHAVMTARVNGEERSRGELGDIYYPWPVILAHAARNTALRPGDILLVRIGWTKFYLGASREVKEELARETVVPGIEGSVRVARWLWENHLAAVASDSPALEALPKAPEEEFLHFHARVLNLVEDPPGVLPKALAEGSQPDLAAQAIEERRAEFRLELADLLAERGLRDVLVLGGGNAALCAAITARAAGASVLMLEAAPAHFRGGNSRHTRNFRAMHSAPLGPLTGASPAEEYWQQDYAASSAMRAEMARLTVSGSSAA